MKAFRCVTYNVYRGGEDRFPLLQRIIQDLQPDFLAIQEACGWQEEGRFQELGDALGVPDAQRLYFSANVRSKSGRLYDMACYATVPILHHDVARDPERIWHVMAHVVLQTPQPLHAILTHLSPQSEDWRLREIAVLEDIAKGFTDKPTLVLGDLNSLSADDPYSETLPAQLEFHDITKFGNPPRFDVLKRLRDAGFEDSIWAQPNHDGALHISVTEASDDRDHLDLRLDYILLNASLARGIQKVHILDTIDTRRASDHFPVVADVQLPE